MLSTPGLPLASRLPMRHSTTGGGIVGDAGQTDLTRKRKEEGKEILYTEEE